MHVKRLILLLNFISFVSFAQSDTLFIKVNFLYGSKPLKEFKNSETKHFGGIHGGHVSLELDNLDYSFGTSGTFHIFAHKKRRSEIMSSVMLTQIFLKVMIFF